VVIEAVKFAEDGSGDVVVRLWESVGNRASGTLSVVGATSAWRSNILEDQLDDIDVQGGVVSLTVLPFEIVTLRFSL